MFVSFSVFTVSDDDNTELSKNLLWLRCDFGPAAEEVCRIELTGWRGGEEEQVHGTGLMRRDSFYVSTARRSEER